MNLPPGVPDDGPLESSSELWSRLAGRGLCYGTCHVEVSPRRASPLLNHRRGSRTPPRLEVSWGYEEPKMEAISVRSGSVSTHC